MITIDDFEKWTGKHIRKANENIPKTDINFDNLRKIYIYESLQNKSDDFYISLEEQFYIFIRKYLNEVSDTILTSYKCPVCGKENDVEFDESNIAFKPFEYKDICFEIENDSYVFKMGEPTHKQALRELADSLEYLKDKVYSDLVFSVISVEKNGEEMTIANVAEFVDGFLQELPIKTYNEIFDTYTLIRPYISVIKVCDCESCQSRSNILLDTDNLPFSIIDRLV